MQQQLNDFTTKFFKYFNRRFQVIDSRFSAQDDHIDGLYRLIDAYVKNIETKEHELVAGDARLERLERRVELLANQSRSGVRS